MEYEGIMDEECIALCDAMNTIPSVETTGSCCGHGRGKYGIWFRVRDLRFLAFLISCIADYEHLGWRINIGNGGAWHSDLHFHIEGAVGDYETSYKFAKAIEENLSWYIKDIRYCDRWIHKYNKTSIKGELECGDQ